MKHFLILLLMAAAFAGCAKTGQQDNPTSKILNRLDAGSLESDREVAIKELRLLGTNAFPYLIAEMNSFKWHTPIEKNETLFARRARLKAAFEALGTNIAPLTPCFLENMNTNRNFVSAMDGLVAMREQGAPYLLSALTNHQAPIRMCAVSAFLTIGITNPDIARLSLNSMIHLLKDPSVATQSLAIKMLARYSVEPDSCIPVLVERALNDPDLVIRSLAVKAVGSIQKRMGTSDSKTIKILEGISETDKSQVVRDCAKRVLVGSIHEE